MGIRYGNTANLGNEEHDHYALRLLHRLFPLGRSLDIRTRIDGHHAVGAQARLKNAKMAERRARLRLTNNSLQTQARACGSGLRNLAMLLAPARH